MPLRNRVDPFGDLRAVAARGLLTGNRGCLVDDKGAIVRRHQVRRWIASAPPSTAAGATRWSRPAGGRRSSSWTRPSRWPPATGPAHCAGGSTYRAYGEAVAAAAGSSVPSADDLDRRLHDERRGERGRGGRDDRGGRRPGDGRSLWTADVADLPDATVIVVDGSPVLVVGCHVLPFHFDGWGPPLLRRLAGAGPVRVLTPATSVAAVRNGFGPVLHPSATRNRSDPSGVYSS